MTYASNISFSHSRVDVFVHHSQYFIGFVIILLILFFLIVKMKVKWIRVTISIFIVPVILCMLIGLIVVSYGVLAPSVCYARYYFYEHENYKYYVTSERYVAFSGSRELKYYKEKDLILFFKRRKELTDVDLSIIKPLAQAAADSLWEKYQR